MYNGMVVVFVLCAVIEAHEHALAESRELDSTVKISPAAVAGESAKLEETQVHYIKSILSLLNKLKAIKDQNYDNDTNPNADAKYIKGSDESDLDTHTTQDVDTHAEASDNFGITNDKSRQLDLIDYFTGEWYANIRKEKEESEEKARKGSRARRLDIELNEDDFPDDDDDIDNPKLYDNVDINGGFIPRSFMGDTMIEMKGRTGIKQGERMSDTPPQQQGERRFLFSPLGIRGIYLKPSTYQHAAPANPFTFSNINSRDILTLNHDVKQPDLSQLPPSDLIQPSYLQPSSYTQPSGLLSPNSLNFLSKFRRLSESGHDGSSTEAVEMASLEKDDNAYPFEPNQSISGYLKKRLRS